MAQSFYISIRLAGVALLVGLALMGCGRSSSGDNTIQKTLAWYTKGHIDPTVLADNFLFKSPYYKDKNKAEFIHEFNDTDFYRTKVLAKIKTFDPLVTLKSDGHDYFAIVAEYHTYSGHNVYETIFGKLDSAGLLVELRSIYDLQETKEAFQL